MMIISPTVVLLSTSLRRARRQGFGRRGRTLLRSVRYSAKVKALVRVFTNQFIIQVPLREDTQRGIWQMNP